MPIFEKLSKEKYPELEELRYKERKTLSELAQYYGVTPARISQILTKLRKEKNATENSSN